MALWVGLEHSSQVLNVAEVWKQRCILDNKSLFSEDALWTKENFLELRTLFVDNPILGKRKFYDKLQEQIGEAKPAICKLAAECLWLLYLFVSNSVIGVEVKRERIAGVWQLSKEPPPNSNLLTDNALRGLANPGIAFLTKVWAEYAFLFTLMVAWKSIVPSEQKRLVENNPWELCEWVTKIEGADVRAFRHMFLYLCYPNYFERICSRNHKKQIHANFSEKIDARIDPYRTNQTLCALDKSVYEIRKVLEREQNTTELDFYRPPLRKLWLHEEENSDVNPPETTDSSPQESLEDKLSQPVARYWVEKTNVRGRPDRMEGPHKVGAALWSPQKSKDGRDIYANMRRVSADDIVFHLTDNIGITGISIAASPADPTFQAIAGTTWSEGPCYRIALKNYHSLNPPLLREAFFGTEEIRKGLLAFLQSDKETGPLFYNKALELNQGAYLTEAPIEVVQLLNRAYEYSAKQQLPIPLSDVNEPAKEKPYEIEDAVEELFVSLEEVDRIIDVWRVKKNVILQGPPGVGKSFAAKKLAYALIGANAPSRVKFIQFHQSYSYEDFVQGFRPTETGFALRNGMFFEFCRHAASHLADKFVFIIDEINRGNLSKIFGELMVLIEADKRGPLWQTPLAYSSTETFFVPENVYLLGLMNTADRSLAVVDYALRRRFAFFSMDPQFEAEKFSSHLQSLGVTQSLIQQIRQRMGDLNQGIRDDEVNLGRAFCVGHSFFCTPRNKQTSEIEWYRQIITTEIIPLLEEYWFDNSNKVALWRERLLSGI